FSQRIIERTTMETAPEPAVNDEEAVDRYTLSPRQEPDEVSLANLSALQELLWDRAGIIRDRESLNEALDILATWEKCLPEPTDRPSYELNNLALTGRLVAEAALRREESRGAHFRSDFPKSRPEWKRHLVLVKE
ncbi:MAG: L-aspartate oxidase, partial [Dehalococcoidales bacterium]